MTPGAGSTDPFVTIAVLALIGGVLIAERLRTRDPDATTLEGLRTLYAEGEISDAMYNRRHHVLVIDEQYEVAPFSWLQEVDGVGPELAFSIAAEFETMAELRAATLEDLEAIHGVGESTAAAIRRRLDDEQPIHIA